MRTCPNCGSDKITNKGLNKNKNKTKRRLKCKICNHSFAETIEIINDDENSLEEILASTNSSVEYIRDEEWISNIKKHRRFVITSAQNNTDIDENFLKSLEMYCEFNNAALMIIPVRYRVQVSEKDLYSYPEEIEEYLFENNIQLHPNLKVMGQLKIVATAEFPLTGLNPLSKGDSLVIGHNQLQMTTLPVQQNDFPVILTTTGTISKENYSISKQGMKAEFNHSNSAVVIEIDNEIFHLRHLNFDGEGFYDFERYYSSEGMSVLRNSIEGIVLGDEHVIFMSEGVKEATFGKDNSIIACLKPKYIIRHDVIDSYAISHHHKNNIFTKYAKWKSGKNDIRQELTEVMKHIEDTTPLYSETWIVPSNHIDHLTRWLNECDPKKEPWNALIYHQLMVEMLKRTEMADSMATYPDPFEIFAQHYFKGKSTNIKFLSRRESKKLFDIEVACHGDKGTNGSYGSRLQYSQLPAKVIIGHSHSPGIEKGAYQVGTSSNLKLEYNLGPSSWLNTHCIVYKNGKRQLVNIIKGKWRL